MTEIYGFCDGYEIRKEIEKESMCHVRIAYKNGLKYCFKYIEKENVKPHILEDLEKEKNILQKLDNLNIVKIIDSNFNSKILLAHKVEKEVAYIVLEFLEEGSLFTMIHQKGPFTERIARYYLKELINTLIFLQNNGITHRDLKPENLMFDKNYNLKIIDFGLSILNDEALLPYNIQRGPVGSIHYCAPEVLESNVISGEKIDVFSSGVILFILLLAKMPFRIANIYDKYYRYIYVDDYSYEFWNGHKLGKGSSIFSPEAKDLIEKMIARDSKVRFTLNDVLNHPWFKLPIASFKEVQEKLVLMKNNLAT